MLAENLLSYSFWLTSGAVVLAESDSITVTPNAVGCEVSVIVAENKKKLVPWALPAVLLLHIIKAKINQGNISEVAIKYNHY